MHRFICGSIASNATHSGSVISRRLPDQMIAHSKPAHVIYTVA